MAGMILGNVFNIQLGTVVLSGATSTTPTDFTFTLPGIQPGEAVFLTCPSSVTASTIIIFNARCVTADVLTITAYATTGTPSMSGTWIVTVIRPEGDLTNNVTSI